MTTTPPTSPADRPDPLDLDADTTQPAQPAQPFTTRRRDAKRPLKPKAPKAKAPKVKKAKPDPSQPLANARHEEMLRLILSGYSQRDAYIATSSVAVKDSIANSSASKVCTRPDFKARCNFLRVQAKRNPDFALKTPATGPQPPPVATTAPDNGDITPKVTAQEEVTQDEIAAIIARTLRRSPSAAEVAALTGALLKVRPQLGQDAAASRPDPAQLVAYVASFAGLTGKDIVQQVGGARLLITKLCDVLAITAVELRDMAQSVVDQRQAT